MKESTIAPVKSFESTIKDKTSFTDLAAQLKENTANTLKEISHDQCPVDVLPPPIAELVEELHIKYKFPKEFCLLYILFVASVAIGNNWRAEVKNNWHEPALLFLCAVALAGQNKTPVQNFFTSVLRKLNKQMFEGFKMKLEHWELKKRTATKEHPFLEEKPSREQILLQDSTLEATVKAIDNNSRGLGILFDELAGFFGGLNRYNSGNELPFYLSVYNCQSYTSNRKTSDDVYLSDPYLSIAGGIQPAILIKLFCEELQDNGTKDRFLFCYPHNLKKEIPTDEEISQDLIDNYTDTIEYLFYSGNRELEKLQAHEREKYLLIPFSSDAKQALNEYLQKNADEVNELNDNHEYRLASAYSKFDYHVIRLSLIIQLLTEGSEREKPVAITVDSVKKGIRLSNYFKWNTRRVHSLISGDPLATYDEKKKAFYNSLPDAFTTGEAVEIAQKLREDEIGSLIKPDAVEKWAKRFIDCSLFSRPSHGNYQKKKH